MNTWARTRDDVRSREQILEAAARAASRLALLGVVPGSVVAVYLRNDVSLMEALVAAGMTGAYATPANWRSATEEARHLENSGTKAIVIHADLMRDRRRPARGRARAGGRDARQDSRRLQCAAQDDRCAGGSPGLERLAGGLSPGDQGDPVAARRGEAQVRRLQRGLRPAHDMGAPCPRPTTPSARSSSPTSRGEGAPRDPAAILAELRGHSASYRLPRVSEFTDQPPREDTGKIFKRELR